MHLRLHDEPHEPLQSFMFAQSSEQLAPHVELETSHVSPDGHVHVEPVQLGGFWLPLPPQAANNSTSDMTPKLMKTDRILPAYAAHATTASIPITIARACAAQIANTHIRHVACSSREP